MIVRSLHARFLHFQKEEKRDKIKAWSSELLLDQDFGGEEDELCNHGSPCAVNCNLGGHGKKKKKEMNQSRHGRVYCSTLLFHRRRRRSDDYNGKIRGSVRARMQINDTALL